MNRVQSIYVLILSGLIFSTSNCLLAQPTNKKKKGAGISSVLQGDKDPTKVRRNETKPVTRRPKTPSPKRSFKDRAKSLKEQINKLKKKGYSDLEPVKKPKEAAEKIKELNRRKDLLDAKFEGEAAKLTKDTTKLADQFGEKWSGIADKLTDGKKRTAKEWNDIYRGSTRAPKDDGGKGSAATKVDFAEIRKVVDQGKKPRGMPAEVWARLQDQYFKQLAELQSNVAAARLRLQKQRGRELRAINHAIKDAEKNFRQLLDSGQKPTDAQLKNLAWQLHRARLAQMIALYNRLMLADQESEGLPNRIQIAIKPLSPSETLEDVARTIETSNRPTAPDRDRFNELEQEGLPDLFPSDPDLNKIKELLDNGEFYGNILKNRMDRNRRLLESLNNELAGLNPDSIADQNRKKEIEKDIKWLVDRNAKDSAALEEKKVDLKPAKSAAPKTNNNDAKTNDKN